MERERRVAVTMPLSPLCFCIIILRMVVALHVYTSYWAASPPTRLQLSLDPETFIFLHCPFGSRVVNNFLLLEIPESFTIPFWFFLSGSHLCK